MKTMEEVATQVLEIIDHLETHNVSSGTFVAQACTNIGISRAWGVKLFKAGTGYTMKDYSMRRKVDEYIRLLQMGFNNKTISHDLGFNSQNSSSRTFKYVVGATPYFYLKEGIEHPEFPRLKAEDIFTNLEQDETYKFCESKAEEWV